MQSIQHKILATFLACALLMMGGCLKLGGGGGNNNDNKPNWDTLKWDQGNWQ